MDTPLKSLEMCAGAGGQAVGLEAAGFEHVALVEIDEQACATLRLNREAWNVLQKDIRSQEVRDLGRTRWRGVDLLAAGVPCPPFSVAGKQLGHQDERDLFPAMLDLAADVQPKAIMIENVRGLLDPRFSDYRAHIGERLEALGYGVAGWRLLNASDYGVPQLRPRVVMVALKRVYLSRFEWPAPARGGTPTVGEALYEEMRSRGWAGAAEWKAGAEGIAPTLVGGSRKHGGPDLGPTRARLAWEKLGVNGKLLAAQAPGPDHVGPPALTVRMAAIVQGFPPEWEFAGRKTQAYRQVGNAFPPPVAEAVGRALAAAIRSERKEQPAAA